ncbi:hypothetical protein [Flavisolibacter tropicus]|uniref:DUF4304 domain-containing protein n=1 Tax=Flavisolibacter tropicus TaxID=1492898 RepID=A0A172U1E6_9BACT|nr:hypothetical protein [Flavisolibacter tropicus]ANE52827.1 hypothetical protein SY85_22470 [Flavisolibacter tropicus]
MKQIDKLILKEVKGSFKRLGYEQKEKDRLYFIKQTEAGCEQIGIVTTYWAGEYNGFFLLSKRVNAIESWLWSYKNEIGIRSIKDDIDVTISFSMKYMCPAIAGKLNEIRQLTINPSPEGIASFCQLVVETIENKAMPLADQFNDIHFLEQQIRSALKDYSDFSVKNKEDNLYSFLNRLGHNFRMLVIAKLAGVADYEMIYEKLLDESVKWANEKAFFKDYPSVMQSLYQDLA